MASDGEEDYLSDKFLLDSAPLTSKQGLTYAQRRKEAQKQAESKNIENRKKSRRQLEQEAREDGLKRSLFERAQAEEQELGHRNKAMEMMLKMGFKPGQTLGRAEEGVAGAVADIPAADVTSVVAKGDETDTIPATPVIQAKADSEDPSSLASVQRHRAVPLSVDIWSGKKGVGLGKRPPSPGVSERILKVARVKEEAGKESFRSRTRDEYEERRAAGRLLSATRTLLTLDEKAGVKFNIFSLDPNEATSFPPELLDVLSETVAKQMPRPGTDRNTENVRLRQQMQLDALQPISGLDSADEMNKEQQKPSSSTETELSLLSEEQIEEAISFLQLNAQNRLDKVLKHLRERYCYCFWCGTQYDNRDDLDSNCPGDDEDAHD